MSIGDGVKVSDSSKVQIVTRDKSKNNKESEKHSKMSQKDESKRDMVKD